MDVQLAVWILDPRFHSGVLSVAASLVWCQCRCALVIVELGWSSRSYQVVSVADPSCFGSPSSTGCRRRASISLSAGSCLLVVGCVVHTLSLALLSHIIRAYDSITPLYTFAVWIRPKPCLEKKTLHYNFIKYCRFLKFFYSNTLREICNSEVMKNPTEPQTRCYNVADKEWKVHYGEIQTHTESSEWF